MMNKRPRRWRKYAKKWQITANFNEKMSELTNITLKKSFYGEKNQLENSN